MRLASLLLAFLTLSASAQSLVIDDVTVISPERPAAHASVLIRDGRIAAVGSHIAAAHATHIDGHGRFLIPGLIDSHVHVAFQGPLDDDAVAAHPELLRAYRDQLPRSYLAFGFTTLVDLDLRSDSLTWFNAVSPHPTLFHCGRAVRTAGGYGAQRPSKDANLDDDPKRAVDRVVAEGGICVKTFIEPGFGGAQHWPVPSAGTLAALRAEATRHGLVLVIHANDAGAWRSAIDAHPDVIAHGLWHWPGPWMNDTPPPAARDVIRAAAHAGIGVQPTIQSVGGDESIFDRSLLDDPRLTEALPHSIIAFLKTAPNAQADEYRTMIAKLYPNAEPSAVMAMARKRAMASLRIMNKEHVKLLFGTDTPANEGIGYPPGLNGRFELGRWFDAGVPLARILRAATLDNAIAFGLRDRGTIEPGKRADLLLLHANPLKTIEAYDAIDMVIVGGVPVERASLLPDNPSSAFGTFSPLRGAKGITLRR